MMECMMMGGWLGMLAGTVALVLLLVLLALGIAADQVSQELRRVGSCHVDRTAGAGGGQ
jgi:hypothetical protein